MTDNIPRRMSLRSSVSKEDKELKKLQEEKEKYNFKNRPFIEYKGKVIYHTTFIDCAIVCDELLKMADDCPSEQFVLGFDMEWPFNFQTGPGKTAVIQISPNLETCYILHVSEMKDLPKGLKVLLEHPKVRVTGNNIKNDVRKLARDFKGFDGDKLVKKCIDSGVLANSILPFQQRWSLENLVTYLLKMRINKDKKVRMSKWHIIPLSEEQRVYAAIDAYASLWIYQKLKSMEKPIADENSQNSLNAEL